MRFASRRAAIVAALALASCAPQQPVAMHATYDERAVISSSPPVKAKASLPCAVYISDISDTRRTPEVLGVVAGRALYAPKDSRAWLRSILSGLDARGVTTRFESDAKSPSPQLAAKVTLMTAWVTDTNVNKNANVVIHASLTLPGYAPLERDYRGDLSNANWNSTALELQHVLDGAFGLALNAMAADFRQLCAAPNAPPPVSATPPAHSISSR